MRTLPSAFTTEKNRETGAFPRYLLQINWPSGERWYSTESITFPVNCEGRVRSWGELQPTGEPGRVGGFGQLEVEILDVDLAFKALMETSPGPQGVEAFRWVWFEGTTWPDSRFCDFAGILGASKFSLNDAMWSLKMESFDVKYDKDIGHTLQRREFPEMLCEECDGEQLPIVYGDRTYRVPACCIDRPGVANLAANFYFTDDYLYINDTAENAFFDVDTEITIVIGVPGNYEVITGGFYDASDRSKFTIGLYPDGTPKRSGVQASGVVNGLYGEGGHQYVLLEQSDITNPSESRNGYMVAFNTGNGPVEYNGWEMKMVQMWYLTGTTVATHWKSAGFDVDVGTEWRMCSVPSVILDWYSGTPVYQRGPWTYAVNYLPSTAVHRVEAKGRIQLPGGNSVDLFLTYGDQHYTVNLNNVNYNPTIGRSTNDPGITTVTVDTDPVTAGFDDNQIYVTLSGINGSNGTSPPSLTNPADILYDIATNPFLGNIPTDRVNAASFNDAAALIPSMFAFALLEPARLMDLLGDLAQQGMCTIFWDGDQLYLRKLATSASADDSVLSISTDNLRHGSLEIQESTLREMPTELAGKFKLSCIATESKIVRDSPVAVGHFGRRRQEMDLWAYQYPTSAALATEFWLLYRLNNQRQISGETYLEGLHLQVGDTVVWEIQSGDPIDVENGRPSRVRQLQFSAGVLDDNQIDTVAITADAAIFSFGIAVAQENDNRCNVGNGEGGTGSMSSLILPVSPMPLGTTTTTTTTTAGAVTTTTGGPTTTTTTAGPQAVTTRRLAIADGAELWRHSDGDANISAIGSDIVTRGSRLYVLSQSGTQNGNFAINLQFGQTGPSDRAPLHDTNGLAVLGEYVQAIDPADGSRDYSRRSIVTSSKDASTHIIATTLTANSNVSHVGSMGGYTLSSDLKVCKSPAFAGGSSLVPYPAQSLTTHPSGWVGSYLRTETIDDVTEYYRDIAVFDSSFNLLWSNLNVNYTASSLGLCADGDGNVFFGNELIPNGGGTAIVAQIGEDSVLHPTSGGWFEAAVDNYYGSSVIRRKDGAGATLWTSPAVADRLPEFNPLYPAGSVAYQRVGTDGTVVVCVGFRGGNNPFFGFTYNNWGLFVFNAADGTILYEYRHSDGNATWSGVAAWNLVLSPAIASGMAIYRAFVPNNGFAGIIAITMATGAEAWRYASGTNTFQVVGSEVWLYTDSTVTKLDLSTGAFLATVSRPKGAVYLDGKWVVGGGGKDARNGIPNNIPSTRQLVANHYRSNDDLSPVAYYFVAASMSIIGNGTVEAVTMNDVVEIGGHYISVGEVGGSQELRFTTMKWSDSGVSASQNHGASLLSVDASGSQVIVGGTSGTGSKTTRCLAVSDLSEEWSANHGGVVRRVATDGTTLLAVGAVSGGATVRAYNTSGTQLWTFNHKAQTNGVIISGDVFICGASVMDNSPPPAFQITGSPGPTSGVAPDVTGNGNDGTLTGGTVYVP